MTRRGYVFERSDTGIALELPIVVRKKVCATVDRPFLLREYTLP